MIIQGIGWKQCNRKKDFTCLTSNRPTAHASEICRFLHLIFRRSEIAQTLSSIAYNLGNPWRRLVLRHKIENWSLTSIQQRLVKTGGQLVKHARYFWLLLAEGHLTRRLFASMLGWIDRLALPSG